MRLLILNNHPAPYFTPLFENLAGKYEGGDMTVCYSRDSSSQAGWSNDINVADHRYENVILNGPVKLIKTLMKNRPTYLICYGYTLTPQIIALIWAMITRTNFAVIGDANVHCDLASGFKRVLKSIWLSSLLKRSHTIPFIGAANKLFWESYNSTPEKMLFVPLAVDNEIYLKISDEKKSDTDSLRRKHDLNDKIVFIYSGRLIKRKNVNLIIRAMRLIEHEHIRLLIVGDGPELEYLENIASADSRIIFAGKISSNLLPLYYALSDVLIMPAIYEPWGLVVNEAMASGLAVIAHKHCGAAIDLIDDDNGIILESFLIEELRDAMLSLSTNKVKLQQMKARSIEKISNWNIDITASRIIDIVSQ